MRIDARNYQTGEPVRVEIDHDRVTSVTKLTTDPAGLPWIAPAFFDLQINGYRGVWFGKPGINADDVLRTLKPHFRFGITRMFPTLITNSRENLLRGFQAIREACERDAWANQLVAGCHLEGPYLSAEDGPRGAHPLDQIRPADWDEFRELQEASGGRIRLLTIAPEVEGAIDLIEKATASGVVCSIGHTAADPDEIKRGVDAGARLSTHLGNGAHGLIRRHPNYIWEQLADDRLVACLITDGHHLPESVVKCIVRVKGTTRCLITCDASGLAGCPPGVYEEPGLNAEVLADGRVVVAGQRQYLAGSGASTDECVSWASRIPEIGLENACNMAGNQVAELFGLDTFHLINDSLAEFVVFSRDPNDGKIRTVTTISRGEVVYGEIPH